MMEEKLEKYVIVSSSIYGILYTIGPFDDYDKAKEYQNCLDHNLSHEILDLYTPTNRNKENNER